jgi:hypothetical protein
MTFVPPITKNNFSATLMKKYIFDLSVRLSVRPSLPLLSLCLVQINCQNSDWMQGLEVRDDLSFRRKKKEKKPLPDLTNQTGRLSSPTPQDPHSHSLKICSFIQLCLILGGKNVMVGQMSWWDKCHGGTNILFYNRWDKCGGGTNVR